MFVYLTTDVNAGLQMKFLAKYLYQSKFNYIFGCNVDIIGIKAYEYPSESFFVVLVLFHPCLLDLSYTKLIKT